MLPLILYYILIRPISRTKKTIDKRTILGIFDSEKISQETLTKSSFSLVKEGDHVKSLLQLA